MGNPNTSKQTAAAPAPVKRVERTAEAKTANFHDAAPARVDRILKAIGSLKGLSRTVRYSWTPAESNKIFTAIADALQETEAAFRNPGTKSKRSGFTL